jgi:hypothetical protein
MLFPYKFRRCVAFLVIGISAALPLASVLRPAQSGGAKLEKPADPWTNAQVLHAADIYVGFRTLFEGGHIPEASFHGTASKEEGLAELKKWVNTLPRSTNVVIYCGCCPFDHCPNVRPAYTGLHDMGFTHVRVLVLPTSFATDWVEKGYPMQKGLGSSD